MKSRWIRPEAYMAAPTKRRWHLRMGNDWPLAFVIAAFLYWLM